MLFASTIKAFNDFAKHADYLNFCFCPLSALGAEAKAVGQ
jgi:hypothetical protein